MKYCHFTSPAVVSARDIKQAQWLNRQAGTRNKLLADLNVEEGKGVTFTDFWGLVDSLATTQFGLQSKEKQVKCVKCSLM
ncbi:hypothetical protein cypCar_00004480 [Cyprinus carpio]|nr:hypothetical protein cypCar_00004480 [Cyprinus carpio]